MLVKVTLPVIAPVPEPGVATATVAIKVSEPPAFTGEADAASSVTVGAFTSLTTWMSGAELPAAFEESPT